MFYKNINNLFLLQRYYKYDNPCHEVRKMEYNRTLALPNI